MERSVQYGKTKINFTLSRSKRKTLAIEVHPDLLVKVIAPIDASLKSIEDKVIKRGSWIIKQIQFFESFLPRTPKREYVSGETHLYLGRRYVLKVKKSDKSEVKLKGGGLLVFLKGNSKAQAVLAGWYKSHTEAIFIKHLKKNIQAFGNFGINEPPLSIKRMKRRWGSLTSTKNLILNPELIKTPVKCIDYVIIHELCHLIHPHHGKEFYELQEQMMPDWRRWKDRLERTTI